MVNYETVDQCAIMEVEARLDMVCLELCKRVVASVQAVGASTFNDLGASVSDAKGRTIAEIRGYMPVHVMGTDVIMKGILDYIGSDNIHPGDFIIANDPFIIKAGHLPDWSFFLPVFYNNELICFLHQKNHQFDSGGAQPGCYFPRGYDAHAEGLLIPPIKIFDKGVEDKGVWPFILHNVRGGRIVRFDVMAIHGAMMKTAEGIVDICDKYGEKGIKQAFDQIIETTEKAVRKVISKWPAGVFHSASAADWDGTRDELVWVRLALTVKPEIGEMILDFSESDPERDFINCPIGHVKSNAFGALYHNIPRSIPHNQGVYNCISVITKEKTVCDPAYPATSGAQCMTVGTQIAECVQLAMAQIVPKDTCAAFSRHLSPIITGKQRDIIDIRTGNIRSFRISTFLADGGSGAVWGYDGWDSVGPIVNSGGAVRAPIETSERDSPAIYSCCEWITDSSGDGEFRGAVGTRLELTLSNLNPKVFIPGDVWLHTGNSDGEKGERFGFLGGGTAPPNELCIERRGEKIPVRCEDAVTMEPGDTLMAKSGGGGGVGNPLNRDIEKVRMDALNQYISVKKAKEVYGVVIDPDTFKVDLKATRKLRESKRK